MRLTVSETPIKTQFQFKRVNKKHPCQICGKTHYCTYTDDGTLAFCMKVSAGAIKQANNRAWIHVLSETPRPITVVPKIQKPEPKASPDLINSVYNTLLDSLVLRQGHFNQLVTKRNLPPETIAQNGYKSVPTSLESKMICEKLEQRFNLDYVPGFFLAEGIRTLNVWGSGIFIPYRNVDRTIQGMQVRLDSGKVRYVWFSSVDKEKGASSGTSIHYVAPEIARKQKEIYLTEGALKADCISEYIKVGVAAIGGVTATNYDLLTDHINANLPEVKKVVLAFDIDWKTNPHVRNALRGLYIALRAKFEVSVEDWDSKYKGFDDYLNAKNRK